MTAIKTRDIRVPRTEFSIPLDEALPLLIEQSEIQRSDRWTFIISENNLIILRERAIIDVSVMTKSELDLESASIMEDI